MKKYYVTGNTAQGQIDLLSSNIKGLKRITLQHPSFTFNTLIIQRIIEKYQGKTSVEILKSPLSSKYLEGVILRDKQLLIHSRQTPPAVQAYEYFAEGLLVHDQLEQIFIKEMDFNKADQVAEKLIQTLLSNVLKEERKAQHTLRFFGTNTIDGVVNEVPNIISPLDTVYHIKGRAGTGKSTFMKKIANACLAQGLDIELYHCSFDSTSIDMVLIPRLNICLFDSTDPHAFQPKDLLREKKIDLYDLAVTAGTDEKYAREIATLTKEYKDYMKKGLRELKQWGEEVIRKDEAIDYSSVELEEAIENIQTKILQQS